MHGYLSNQTGRKRHSKATAQSALLGRQLIVSSRAGPITRLPKQLKKASFRTHALHRDAARRRHRRAVAINIAIMWNRARAALDEARALGVSTNYSAWFGGGTNASAAVLAPAQVAAIAPLVRVTAAYVVMYYAFCFFQSWSKLYLFASRRPSLFFPYVDSCSCASSLTRLFDEAPPFGAHRGDSVRLLRHHRASGGSDVSARAPNTPSTRYAIAATHVRHRTGGGQPRRTPTARDRRSCS